MNKLMVPLTLAVAALVAVPTTAPAAKKKKPKPAVYTIYGGYDFTSVIYTVCEPPGGGESKETTRVKKHYSYAGDTKRGFKITETEQQFLIRESTNEFLPSITITGEPSSRTSKSSGSDVLQIKKSRGVYSFDGIGIDSQRQSFKVPKKVGDSTKVKISTKAHSPSTPGFKCSVSYEDTSVEGTVLIRRIQ